MLQAFGKLCVGGGRARLVEHVERACRHGRRVGRRNQSTGEIRPGNAAKHREAVDGRRDANVGAPAGLIRQDPTSTDAPVEPAVPQICVAVPLVALQVALHSVEQLACEGREFGPHTGHENEFGR